MVIFIQMKNLKINAFAKINLFLEILNKRDDGYHNIETVFQNISLADSMIFEINDGATSLKCEGNPDIPADESNLIIKALRTLERDQGASLGGVKISLKKRIPSGAGLGGGSADAAAALVALNRLFGLGYNLDDLTRLSSKIGMDVPFFIAGGTAVGKERGDLLEKTVNRLDYSVVVVKPDASISTPYAYSLFAGSKCEGDTSRSVLPDIITALVDGDRESFEKKSFNRFEIMLSQKFPWINEIKQMLIEAGCKTSFMTGSGSGIVGLTDGSENGRRIVEHLKAEKGLSNVYLCDFVDKGWEIIEEQ